MEAVCVRVCVGVEGVCVCVGGGGVVVSTRLAASEATQWGHSAPDSERLSRKALAALQFCLGSRCIYITTIA